MRMRTGLRWSRPDAFRALAAFLATVVLSAAASPAWADESPAAPMITQPSAQAIAPPGAQPTPIYVVCPTPAKESDAARDSSSLGWPFWTVVGVALVGGFFAGYYLGGSGDLAMPSTTFGAKRFSGARP
jgi:hypothetical protein